MGDDFEAEAMKRAAADVLDLYSKFVMVCVGHRTRPCDMRMHLMKEVSGLPTSLESTSSCSGTSRLLKEKGMVRGVEVRISWGRKGTRGSRGGISGGSR